MSQPSKQRPPDSEIRQSQLLTTFGPGAMVDLPNRSVIIAGLTYWKGETQYIREDRLRDKVRHALNLEDKQGIQLRTPPTQSEDPQSPRSGVDAFVFPTWFLAQVEVPYIAANGKTYRTRPLVSWSAVKAEPKFRGKKVHYVPVRFVQACPNGHLSDIDWYAFVHNDFQTTNRGQLWLDEAGSGNDFEEIFVRCEQTGKRRPLSQAKLKDSKVLGYCEGHRPWLGSQGQEPCRKHAPDQYGNSVPTDQPEYNRLLIRSASNAYFSQLLSVISMPDPDAELRQAVDPFYTEDLQYAEDLAEIKQELRKPKFQDLSRFGANAVWDEVQRRKQGTVPDDKSIKQVELEALLACTPQHGHSGPSNKIFDAVTRDPSQLSSQWDPYIDKVVLVHRLREVIALIGFTRFEAAPTSINGEIEDDLAIGVRRASLDFEPKWIPAIENLGEGVFISFKPAAIEAWLQREPVKNRAQTLLRGYERWADSRGIPRNNFPDAPYIMLHSLSHLLITSVSLDCGYTSSAIRERIYVFPEIGYGILLHTGTSGSEGTLGGLVDVGRHLEEHLTRALAYGRLCSNDPVCAQHQPDNQQEDRFLHGAACHGCLLIGETSCERRNELLDRALVVNTVENLGSAFFPETLV
jgi:hypothetical protein